MWSPSAYNRGFPRKYHLLGFGAFGLALLFFLGGYILASRDLRPDLQFCASEANKIRLLREQLQRAPNDEMLEYKARVILNEINSRVWWVRTEGRALDFVWRDELAEGRLFNLFIEHPLTIAAFVIFGFGIAALFLGVFFNWSYKYVCPRCRYVMLIRPSILGQAGRREIGDKCSRCGTVFWEGPSLAREKKAEHPAAG